MPNTLSYISFTPPPSPTEILYETEFDSIDGMVLELGGSGSVQHWADHISLETGSTQPSSASLEKRLLYHPLLTTWTKKRSIVAKALISFSDLTSEENYLCTGNRRSLGLSFGFRFKPDYIVGYCENGNGKAEVVLVGTGGAPWQVESRFEAILYPGDKVVFFIDGVNKGSVALELPEGDYEADYLFGLFVSADDAYNNIIRTSYMRMIQWT